MAPPHPQPETADPELVRLPDGRQVQIWLGGDPAGVPILFFHGCPDTRHAAWSGAATAARTGVWLVAFNRPGYGRSQAHDSTVESVADDAAALADALRLQEFAVLGMSIGGIYALATAARHPDRVLRAGVVASPGEVPSLDPPWHRDDLDDAGRAFITGLAGVDVDTAVARMRPDLATYVARLDPADSDDAALVGRYRAQLAPEDAALVAAQPVAAMAAGIREALSQLDGYLRDAALTFRPWRTRPEAVRCPTWLWYGDRDANASLRNGTWLRDRVPDARLVVRTGATHLASLWDHWDDVLATLGG